VKDASRNRLALIHQRFSSRIAPHDDGEETFELAFDRARESVIQPVMEEIAEALRELGHAPAVHVGPVAHEGRIYAPAVALRLGMRGAAGAKNHVVFAVIRWKGSDGPEVLAFHEKDRTPFDLFRYPHPREITKDRVEQLLLDSIESLFAQNASTPRSSSREVEA
jgi:hypothetical protein